MSCPIKLSKITGQDILSWELLIIGLLIAPFAVITLWLKITLSDTDQFAKTLSPLSTNPVIMASVSRMIADNFFNGIDAEKKIKQSLPEESKFLAPVLAISLKSFIQDQGQNLVTSEQFNKVWETVIKTLHPQIMDFFGGKGNTIKAQDGAVVLDFKDILTPLKKQLKVKGIDIFDNVNIETKITLLKSEKLASIQTVIKLILYLGVILPIFALVFIIGSVLASSNHRKFLVNVGFGLSISMVFLLYLIYLGQQQFIASSGQLGIEATAAFYKIITHYLQIFAWIILILGIILGLVANYLPKRLHVK